MVACCTKREKDDGAEEPGFFERVLGLGGSKMDATNGSTAEAEGGEAEKAKSARALSRHVAASGLDPNLLMYVCGDPPTDEPVSGNSASASSSSRGPRAFHIPVNTVEGVPIATELFEGKAVVLCRPSTSPIGTPLPESHPYASYFASRKRSWEFRVQGRFKRIPKGELQMGVVLRDFNYDQAVASHSKMVKSTGMALVKYDCYLSWGDRCEASKLPDAELSHMVTDLAAFDQIVITREGQVVPDLACGELQNVGESCGRNLVRKDLGISEFSKVVKEAIQDMKLNDTFTMCFWGVSQVVDILNWQFTFSRWMTVSMGGFFQDCPLHVAMYELDPPAEGEDPKRQLESRKGYYLDFMFWSNTVNCPHLADKYVFVDAPEKLENFAADLCGGGDSLTKVESFHTAGSGCAHGRRSLSSSDSAGQRRASGAKSAFLSFLRWIPASTCAAMAAPEETRRPESKEPN